MPARPILPSAPPDLAARGGSALRLVRNVCHGRKPSTLGDRGLAGDEPDRLRPTPARPELPAVTAAPPRQTGEQRTATPLPPTAVRSVSSRVSCVPNPLRSVYKPAVCVSSPRPSVYKPLPEAGKPGRRVSTVAAAHAGAPRHR